MCKDPLLNFESPESYAFYAAIHMTRNKKKIDYLMTTSGISSNSLDLLTSPET